MKPIPWSRVETWFCKACGECCKDYRVPVGGYEALKLIELFGSSCLELRDGRYYLKKRRDGRCIFQVQVGGNWICGIQDIKPLACRLWPFVVYKRPKLGYSSEAEFEFKGRRYYVYVDPECRGVKLGEPSDHLVEKVIPEFIALSEGYRLRQVHSTSQLVQLRSSAEAFKVQPLSLALLKPDLLSLELLPAALELRARGLSYRLSETM
ncbi:MAG: YkgJ family cysteine cluster protein [Thermoprotei archaeon]|nr:MAG: YkgJ family cysteine cluster protein [Thermoprotei archaeon]